MNPYSNYNLTPERLRKYKGFENMSEDMLDLAVKTINTLADVYLNNRKKIEEYEQKKRLKED